MIVSNSKISFQYYIKRFVLKFILSFRNTQRWHLTSHKKYAVSDLFATVSTGIRISTMKTCSDNCVFINDTIIRYVIAKNLQRNTWCMYMEERYLLYILNIEIFKMDQIMRLDCLFRWNLRVDTMPPWLN